MKIMNIINKICILTDQLYYTKWYQFFRKYKLHKQIYYLKNKLISKGIFSFSDGVITFFLSCPESVRESCDAVIKESCIKFHIGDTLVDYNPNKHSFEISYPETDTKIVSFTIYEFSNITNKLIEVKWKELVKDINEFYIKLIEDAAIELIHIKESSD